MIDETLKEELRVTVIATGFEERTDARAQKADRQSTTDEFDIKPFATDDLDIPAFLRRK